MGAGSQVAATSFDGAGWLTISQRAGDQIREAIELGVGHRRVARKSERN